jgi:hypothetical protein
VLRSTRWAPPVTTPVVISTYRPIWLLGPAHRRQAPRPIQRWGRAVVLAIPPIPPNTDDTNRRRGTGQDEATGTRSGLTAASGQRPMTISGTGRRSG